MEREQIITELSDYLESARIMSGALFEKYANSGLYDKAVIAQLVRDTLVQQKNAIENLENEYRD